MLFGFVRSALAIASSSASGTASSSPRPNTWGVVRMPTPVRSGGSGTVVSPVSAVIAGTTSFWITNPPSFVNGSQTPLRYAVECRSICAPTPPFTGVSWQSAQ